ncbi:hypothetical protein VTN02DRAFT_122 [Thermoascus thermophilus]
MESWRGLRSAEPRRRSAETRSGLAPERSLTASVSASAPRAVRRVRAVVFCARLPPELQADPEPELLFQV